jgi:hypothetical protein
MVGTKPTGPGRLRRFARNSARVITVCMDFTFLNLECLKTAIRNKSVNRSVPVYVFAFHFFPEQAEEK